MGMRQAGEGLWAKASPVHGRANRMNTPDRDSRLRVSFFDGQYLGELCYQMAASALTPSTAKSARRVAKKRL